MKLIFAILMLLVIIVSCKEKREFDYWSYSNLLAKNSAKKMANQNHLTQCGSGGDIRGGTVNRVFLHFMSNMTSNEEQAIELLFKINTALTNAFNEDKKIRPFLKDFPFTPNNLEIIIGFNTKNTPTELGNISSIHLYDDKVFYIQDEQKIYVQ